MSGRKPGTLNRASAPFKALEFLGENGATTETDLAAAILGDSTAPRSPYHVMRRLEERGLIARKVWLTPAGLDALRSKGWTPGLAGVVA